MSQAFIRRVCLQHVTSDTKLPLDFSPASGLVLEPFCEGVAVEPPYPELSAAGILHSNNFVPYSKPTEDSHHYIHLRAEDVVHFQRHHRHVRYSVVPKGQDGSPDAKMPPAITEDEHVQVKSSDPGVTVDMHDDRRSVANSKTEDEGDLDRTFTPMSVTPATSRLTGTREIKETPKRRDPTEEDAPFSTAQEPPPEAVGDGPPPQPSSDSSSEIVVIGEAAEADGASSPIVQAQKQRADRAKQGQAAASHIQSVSEADIEMASTSKTPKESSGRRRRRTTPARPLASADNENVLKFEQGVLVGDSDKSEPQNSPSTSPALFPNGRAYEAAARSLSNKRKAVHEPDDAVGAITKTRKISTLEEDDGEQGEEVPPASARTHASAKAATGQDCESTGDAGPARNDGDLVTAGEESDDDGPSQVPAGPTASSSRLPKAAHTEEGEGEGEEIVAKPRKKSAAQTRSSPEVIMAPLRARGATSKTPTETPSSTATSSFSGKPPKLLISQFKPSAGLAKFMRSQGALTIENVPTRRTNFVCVVKSDKKLTKTPKVLRSLALGKQVVTERWINDSAAAKELLDPAAFVHEELAATIDIDRRRLFSGKVLFFTNAAVQEYGADNWFEMKQLATEAGACSVDSGTATKGGRMTGRNTIVYLGVDKDEDVTALMKDYDRVVYHKDIIKEAVVSGELHLDDGTHQFTATAVEENGRR